VAYPTAPLQPNTPYTVNLSGTINGTPFTRSFTFTTGNVVG
ncbi:serine protease, partial [Salmonella enterica subsp. enterica serovar Heidelberg]